MQYIVPKMPGQQTEKKSRFLFPIYVHMNYDGRLGTRAMGVDCGNAAGAVIFM